MGHLVMSAQSMWTEIDLVCHLQGGHYVNMQEAIQPAVTGIAGYVMVD